METICLDTITRGAVANPMWASDKLKSAEEVMNLFHDSAQVQGKGSHLRYPGGHRPRCRGPGKDRAVELQRVGGVERLDDRQRKAWVRVLGERIAGQPCTMHSGQSCGCRSKSQKRA